MAYYSASERMLMIYLFLRLSRVSEAVVIHLMPSWVITSDWVNGDKLLPIRAATKGFCLWVAIGQAKVREKTSIRGKFRTWIVFGNSNFVYINVFRLPVKRAKSWFFLRGSVPAPIISHPIISLVSPSCWGLVKLLIRVVRPNSRWL